MTDSSRSMNEVPGLVEERRRYEGWLAALDARRETTPKHVFDRVRADYLTRMERVAEQLASHRQAIEEEKASVQSRLSLLEAEERLQRDERAELELRSHVGELVGADAEVAFTAVDGTITKLVAEKEELTARVTELQGLLDEGAARPAPEASTAAAPEAEAAVATEPAPHREAVTVAEPSRSEVAPAEEQVVAVAAHAEPEAAQVAAPAAPVPPTRGASGSFDELAFLSSVVGKDRNSAAIERRSSEPLLRPSDNVERDDPAAESLLAGIDKNKRKTGEHPLAANVPANTPIVLRPTGTMEQAKTLKCNECGAMNYPTEWYCERCGAELAAL
jgi:hypothetical protein